jgi:site-specific recombinase XerD
MAIDIKADLYGHKARHLNWKKLALQPRYIEDGLTKENSKTLVNYVFDMELGANIALSSKKGPRSFCRLNTIRQKISQMMRVFQDRGISDITKITENQAQSYFVGLRTGELKTKTGAEYKSVQDYVKIFKSFWHWHLKLNKKQGKFIEDITLEMDSSKKTKPDWVYLDEEQVNKLLANCKSEYKSLIAFLYDSGARPEEVFSLLVQDIHMENDEVFCNIRNEISKVIGRKIKLLKCGKDLVEYIKRNNLKPEERLFIDCHTAVNQHLGEIAGKIFGKGVTKARASYPDLTMYDIRHNSACYWRKRYGKIGLDTMRYRFGWKTMEQINYYTEFLGMQDTISQDDLFIDITKTELEKEVKALQEKHKLLDSKIEDMQKFQNWANRMLKLKDQQRLDLLKQKS